MDDAHVQPQTFVYTDAEAATVQSLQMAHQARVARANPALLALSIAVPVVMIGAVFAVDLIWYGGAMPAWLFVTLLFVFLAGMFTQILSYRLSLELSKRRVRHAMHQCSRRARCGSPTKGSSRRCPMSARSTPGAVSTGWSKHAD
jgi:hypothetical protein